MKYIGLLMVADEDDILERTLSHNAELVDCFYALDGSAPGNESESICRTHPKCAGYITDAEVPYVGPPRDGWRQALLLQATVDHGYDNWFLLLHGDEVWTTDPRDFAALDGDALRFRLPFFFPRTGEPWNNDQHPIDQLHWLLGPGWPEYRMFRGNRTIAYNPRQHFDVLPRGLTRSADTGAEILHYPYRSPAVQTLRANRHQQTGFDPDNYRHITDRGAVYWTDEMIADYQRNPCWTNLRDLVAA